MWNSALNSHLIVYFDSYSISFNAAGIRVSWAGLLSNPFNAVNGVKQGGVLSPVLFCIYIDGLLTKFSESGVGCYIGDNFLGSLGYADDIVLIAPSPSAMRKLFAICDGYASDFDIIFNADKSKFIVFVSPNRRFLVKAMNSCVFILVVI